MDQKLIINLIRLARPHQWVKSTFVVIGPAYAVATGGARPTWEMGVGVLGAVLAFAMASSACYVVNDIRDREADRSHPRKRNRPVAAGMVSVRTAALFAVVLLVLSGVFAALSILRIDPGQPVGAEAGRWRWLVVALGVYVVNTTLYSVWWKHVVVLDVISLASGFVVRVLGGCAAAGVVPSSFLLNVTFFVSMFLAFGKRLGERRTMGDGAAAARAVQGAYTDELLRMAVVVTGVATLVTYAGYVEKHGEALPADRVNLLWLTMLPATYGLLRCIVLLERGRYDDPTEIAARDRAIQAAVVLFGVLTVWGIGWGR